MASQDQRKPRNNARKAAARALQRQHPEMSYLQALAAVTKSANAEASNPLDLRNLLNIASAEDITARQHGGVLNTTAPVGLSDSGETVSLNIAHANQAFDGTGPHGIITGPGALDLALAMAAALRANNSAESIHVAFAGPEHRGRPASAAVDHVVTAPWHDWMQAKLTHHGELAMVAKETNVRVHSLGPTQVIIVDAEHDLGAEHTSVLHEAIRTGRTLGVHILLVCPDAHSLQRVLPLRANVTFTITLSNDGDRRSAVAETHNASTFNFTATQFRDNALATWITAARQAS
jgi:hypothetical protein